MGSETEVAGRIAAALPEGIELVDVQSSGRGARLLRIFIDREGGVDVEACSAVSAAIKRELDGWGPFAGQYTLEVSSPGLERALTRPEHFQRFLDRKAKVRLARSLDGKRRLIGRIVDADDERAILEEEDGTKTEFWYGDVSRATLTWTPDSEE